MEQLLGGAGQVNHRLLAGEALLKHRAGQGEKCPWCFLPFAFVSLFASAPRSSSAVSPLAAGRVETAHLKYSLAQEAALGMI